MKRVISCILSLALFTTQSAFAEGTEEIGTASEVSEVTGPSTEATGESAALGAFEGSTGTTTVPSVVVAGVAVVLSVAAYAIYKWKTRQAREGFMTGAAEIRARYADGKRPLVDPENKLLRQLATIERDAAQRKGIDLRKFNDLQLASLIIQHGDMAARNTLQ